VSAVKTRLVFLGSVGGTGESSIIRMKGSGQRSSVSVSQSLANVQPALRLLRLLNPKNRPSIHLDDLVLLT